ncbi:MAG: hypothetical protein C4318_07380 [Acidimicrobiia bacterium]
MAGWWTIVRIAHVLGACIWVGSLVAFTFFVRPGAQRTLGPADSEELINRSGRQIGFFIAAILVPLQLFSGMALLLHRGFTVVGSSSSLYRTIILTKIVIFFVVIAISAAHGVASARSAKNASRILAYLALGGSLALTAMGAALVS